MSLRLPFLLAVLFLAFFVGSMSAQAAVNSCDTARKVSFEADQTGWNQYFTSATRWNQHTAFNFARSTTNAYFCYAASLGYSGNCYKPFEDPKFPFIILASGYNPGEDVRPVSPPEPNTFDSVSFPPTTSWSSCAAFCKNIEGATHCFDNADGGMCYAAKLKPGSTVRAVSSGSSGTSCENGSCNFTGFTQAGTCTPLPQPADLTAGAVSPATSVAGVASSFSATVANSGVSNAGASQTRFQWATSAAGAGATLIANTATPAVAASGSQTVSASHAFPSAGTYYMRACADAGSVVAESNENNNCGAWTAVTVTAGAPATDLTAGGITPETGSLGQTQTLSGTLTNLGSLAAGATRSYFQITAPSPKGNATAVVNTPAIAGGAGSVASFTYTFGYPGNYSARLCADWYGEVTESNEGNNCGPWTSIAVSETPVPSSVSCTVNTQSAVPGGSVTYTAMPVGGAMSPYTWVGSDGATGFGSGPSITRTFSEAASGSYGMQVSATGASSSAQCPIVSVAATWCTAGTADLSITATPDRVRAGQQVALTWNASGVNGQSTTCTVSGPGMTTWSSSVSAAPSCSASGSTSVTVNAQSTYTLTCGGESETVTVNVIPNFQEF